MIVIDRSGSMSGTPLANAKTAATFLIDRMEFGTSVGVISFAGAGNVTLIQPIIQLEDQSHKESVKAVINALTAGGGTAIGDAANLALNTLLAYGNDTYTRLVFLLSDGHSNEGAGPLSVIPEYQEAQVPMFTFGYGSSADEVTLRAMAEQTGGRYYYSPNSLSQITQVFADANQQVADNVGIGFGAASLPPGEAQTYVFPVDSTLESIGVAVTWAGAVGAAQVSLFAPDGTTLDPFWTSSVGGYTQKRFLADTPATGDWRIVVISNSGGPLEVSYNIDGITGDAVPYTLVLTNLTGTQVQYPEPMALFAVLSKDRPIAAAGVTATVTGPDGTESLIALRDDGVAPDELADDGRYVAVLDYTMNGLHEIQVWMDNSGGLARMTSRGTLSQPPPGEDWDDTPDVLVGEQFQRTALLQVQITGFASDDHGNTAGSSTAIQTTNADVAGRIDYPGDVDVFSAVVPAGAAGLTFRTTDVALGMDVRLRILGSDGLSELANVTRADVQTGGNYVAYYVEAPEGTRLFGEVSHTNPGASRGTYNISAGSRLASDDPYDDGPTTTDTSDRAQCSHKADLFVWPYVVLKWDNNGTPGNPADDKLLQDVFISVTNDSTGGAGFKMYYVDAYNCHGVDARLQLTGSDPAYFSAFTGLGGGVGGQNNGGVAPPFKALNMAGYPDGPNANLRKLEGYIVGWAVNQQNYPIGTNQLAASATVVDYQTESAWEYKPWAFRSNFTGVKPDPTMLALNFGPGQYQKCPSHLLLDFWASGSGAFGSSVNAPIVPSLQEFELTLVNAWMDFRPVPDFNGDGTPGNSPIDAEPATTSVQVQVWNEMEQPVSGTQKCLTCWDSTLGANYGYMGAASPFALTTLGTDKGKARLWAEATSACSRAGNPNSNPPILAKPARNLPILGVAHRTISWGGTRATRTESGLIGMGTRDDGVIYFDTSDQGDPPTMPMGNLRALPPSATQDDEPPA